MIERRILPILTQRLKETPAVVLLGPRQTGKTTLAHALGKPFNILYLDLESDSDRAKLVEPELYLKQHQDRLVVIDEVHRAPGLFPILRGLIDSARRQAKAKGLYLLLGSASLDLLKQSGETLAGRVSYLELSPFDLTEIGSKPSDTDRLWLRGGFPDSYLAESDARSLRWRQDFIRSYLEREIPQLGSRIPTDRLRRLWTMLAHHHGGILNVAQLAGSLGVDGKTAAAYIDLLVDLLLVQRLQPWHANVGKRLVKSPKVYIRDSGLLHALLALGDKEALLAHPVVGMSWEGFVIEQCLRVAPEGVQGFFYRTSVGAEIDLLLMFPGGQCWAVEIKRSLTPRPEKGFHLACDDLKPDRRLIVYPGKENFATSHDVEVVSLNSLITMLTAG